MHKDLVVNTPALAGSSELLVIAPIITGFVPALDAVTYTSRSKLLLRALHAGRKNAHEYNLFRAVSDAVERVGVIHTLRLAVLDPNDASPAGSILLSVNFDGAYEAYVRTIWQKSARLLDLIFCNTVGHITGWDHSYDDWSRWMLSRQVDTPFYFGTPSQTQGDGTALRMQDRFQRREGDVDLIVTQTAIADAEHIAWELIRNDRDPQSGPFTQPPSEALAAGEREGVRQGLQGLAGMYRLTDLYAPGTSDGDVLLDAARELLPEFVRMRMSTRYSTVIEDAGGERLAKQLQWMAQPRPLPAVRVTPQLPSAPVALPAGAQAGIMRSVDGATRACVCLVAFDGPGAAAAFLNEFKPTAQGAIGPNQPCLNVALTFDGLRACGVPEAVLDQLPIEFRQGMQRRAGLLGDVQSNHPRRWTLPVLNWPAAADNPAAPAPAGAAGVALEAVHALVHLRTVTDTEAQLGQQLLTRFKNAEKAGAGVRPLSVQWLRRNFDPVTKEAVDHFGYSDGHSDPVFDPDNAFDFPNQVHVGEALVGHANAADAAPQLSSELAPLLQDASYLVVRKLRQDVYAFDAVVQAVANMQIAGLDKNLVKAKLMGRKVDGTPLVASAPGGNPKNDFNYDDDPTGSACPFAAHIRRANPRVSDGAQATEVQALPGARPPRLFRRGMSYTDSLPGGGVEKGLFFMAYNSRIGEQFEVVQRWLASGNSSGAPSGAADPICGVAEAGRQRFFRFEHKDQVIHMPLDGKDELGAEPKTLVRLCWGSYFLAPSVAGVGHLAALATAAAGAPPPANPVSVTWSVDEGEAIISRILAIEQQAEAQKAQAQLKKAAGLQEDAQELLDNAKKLRKEALEQWKAALEDPESRREFETASVWAGIRQKHGGLLRTLYGLLVADGQLVQQMLTDVGHRYSVKGYQERLLDTIGPIFLGLDDGKDYSDQASACNGAIQQLTFEDGYNKARQHAKDLLACWIADADKRSGTYGELRWDLNIDMREMTERVLARLLEDWFGLSTAGNFLTPDGFNWAFDPNQPARYPGAFYTPSRYTFQPQPKELVEQIARKHGQHLREHMTDFLKHQDGTITAPVTKAVLESAVLKRPDGTKDYDLAARTIAGAIMGFVPTTDNNLRRIVDEWLRDLTMWDLRARTAANSLDQPAAGNALLREPIVRAMMLRPMPEFIWRTALQDHVLTDAAGQAFDVHAEERVVLGLISATQQGLERGERSEVPVFGGDRTASPAPRHACPGMPSAMGVIAGVLSAIIDSPCTLRPAAVGALLSFEGPVTPPAAPAPRVAAGSPSLKHAAMYVGAPLRAPMRALVGAPMGVPLGGGAAAAPPFRPAGADKGVMLGWGDSWLNLNHPFTTLERDLARSLGALGWDTSEFSTHSDGGLTLREMAEVAPRKGFYRLVRQRLPKAILIDGGGNDVHDTGTWSPSALHRLAKPAGSNPPLDPVAVTNFVHVLLRGRLQTVLTNLIDVTGGAIPIFVHGYDHPIPDARAFVIGGPWLDPVNGPPYSLSQGTEIMRLLINELNDMIKEVAELFTEQKVHHLDLRGTLAAQPGFAADYTQWWLNELHPTEAGYDALGAVADAFITSVVAP